MVHRHHASIFHRNGDIASQILDARTWSRKEKCKKGKRKKGEGKGRERKSGKGKGRDLLTMKSYSIQPFNHL